MPNRKSMLKNNMQKYRVWKGLLQKDLAEALGISLSEIRLIERNKACPTPRNQEKICAYFGVTHNQMFYEN